MTKIITDKNFHQNQNSNNNHSNHSSNNDDNSSNNNQNISDNIILRSKKRKAVDLIPSTYTSSSSSKNIIDPILSLVFIDGSTATISQAQLTLSMADKRMAAPSEYQVLSTLISFLNDPVLNIVKYPTLKRTSDKIESLSNESHITTLETSDGLQGYLEEIPGNSLYETDPFSWITVLESLLPQNLSKKQRKNVKIIDVADLISYGSDISLTKDLLNYNIGKKNINNNLNTKFKNKLNNRENSVRSDDNQFSHNKSSMSSDASECSGRGSDRGSGGKINNNNCLSNIAYNMICGCNHPVVEEDNQESDQIVEHDFNRIIILLRPQIEYRKIDQKKNTTLNMGSHQSVISVKNKDEMIFQSNFIQENMDNKIERCKLNYMLNNWLYRKKIHKHDTAKQSLLYLKSSIFSFENEPEKNMKQEKELEAVCTDRNVHLISPGIAVCVLQHWAYHHVLLPTFDIAIQQYQNEMLNNEM